MLNNYHYYKKLINIKVHYYYHITIIINDINYYINYVIIIKYSLYTIIINKLM